MAGAPGLPGTSFICRSCGVIGCQSSFCAKESDAVITQKNKMQHRNTRIAAPLRVLSQTRLGNISSDIYTKTGALTRVDYQQAGNYLFFGFSTICSSSAAFSL